jgi:hypothetical protein
MTKTDKDPIKRLFREYVIWSIILALLTALAIAIVNALVFLLSYYSSVIQELHN